MMESSKDSDSSYQLNWLGFFHDPLLQDKFHHFYLRRKYTKVMWFLNVYISLLIIPMNIWALSYNLSEKGWLFCSILLLASLTLVFTGCLICWEKHIPPSYDKWLSTIRRVYMIASSVFVLISTSRKLIVSCDELPESIQNYIFPWHCENDPEVIPSYSVPLLGLLPLGGIICLNETRLDFVFLNMLFADGGFILIAALCAPETSSVKDMLLVILLNVLLCIDIHRSHIELFMVCDKLEETVAENKRMQEENRAAELRGMIANVTHDLKTPLASFMSGIDIMAHTINEMVMMMKLGEFPLLIKMESQFDSLVECFKNMRNTHMFMTMMINRCLDYTKASKGLKLTPKYETIPWYETLSMPLQCMKNIQEKIEIDLLPWSEDICSHIITDKQWLQENILCLLSNAVKYSSHGPVQIVVTVLSYPTSNLLQTSPPTSFHSFPVSAVAVSSLQQQHQGVSTVPTPFPWFLLMSQPVHSKILPGTTTAMSTDPTAEGRRKLSRINNTTNIITTTAAVQRTYHPPHDNAMNNHDHVAAAHEETKTFLRFEVSDHGIGLTEDGKKNLFNPFQQAQKLAGGTGLGLYSLAKRMDAIQGHYGVEHRRDGQQGCIFWFEIPYRPDILFARNTIILQDTMTSNEPQDCPIDNMTLLFSHDHTNTREESLTVTATGGSSIAAVVTNHASTQPQPIEAVAQLFHTIESISTKSNRKKSKTVSPTKYVNHHPVDTSTHTVDPSAVTTTAATAATAVFESISPQDHTVLRNTTKVTTETGLHILIAEDSPTIAKMISMMLRQQHHRITLAENGEIALQYMQTAAAAAAATVATGAEQQQQGYDLVLMDLQMPVLDGLEATRRFRVWEKQQQPQQLLHQQSLGINSSSVVTKKHEQQQVIIGMSANSDIDTMDAAFQAGVNDFIPKPFQINSFNIILQKFSLLANKK